MPPRVNHTRGRPRGRGSAGRGRKSYKPAVTPLQHESESLDLESIEEDGDELQITRARPLTDDAHDSVGDGQNESIVSDGTSASSLAGKTERFEDWKSNRHIKNLPSEWQDLKKLTDPLKYPKFIGSNNTSKSLKRLLGKFDDNGTEMKAFMRWYKRLKPEQIEGKDKYGAILWLAVIAMSWSSLVYHENNEAEYRRPIDMLLELAFVLRNGSKHTWFAEQFLALPGEPSRVRADAITTLELPTKWRVIIENLENRYLFTWSYSHIVLTVITFAIEYKRPDSPPGKVAMVYNQLVMDFHSALLQQRALGCEGPIFGATVVQDEFRFYVSFLTGDVHYVGAILEPFKIFSFVDFFKCYDYQTERLAKHFKAWGKEHQEWLEKRFGPEDGSGDKPWRAPKPDKPNTQKDEQAGGENVGQDKTTASAVADTDEKSEQCKKDETQHDCESVNLGRSPFVASRLTQDRRDALSGAKESGSKHETADILDWATKVHDCQKTPEDLSQSSRTSRRETDEPFDIKAALKSGRLVFVGHGDEIVELLDESTDDEVFFKSDDSASSMEPEVAQVSLETPDSAPQMLESSVSEAEELRRLPRKRSFVKPLKKVFSRLARAVNVLGRDKRASADAAGTDAHVAYA